MENNEIKTFCTFYAISPIHAGSGASTAVVDLPIQRERHTNWPHVQASAVKGALRAHYRKFAGDDAKLINIIFGSDKDNDDTFDHSNDDTPGAIAVSDAKLLAFPVRSNMAPFVWVTSPAVLKRFKQDLELIGEAINFDVPKFANEDDAFVLNGNISGRVILEDAVVNVQANGNVSNPLSQFSQLERLLLISDTMYDYIVSSCTEVQTQIKIEAKTGTTKDGSLRYQELLPADSFLYSVVYFTQKNLNHLQADMIKKHVQGVVKDFIQIGGDETLGRGLCRVKWLEGGK